MVGVAIAFAVALAWCILSLWLGPALGFVDRPDDVLKTHRTPAVPLGGVGVFLGVLAGSLVEGFFSPWLAAAMVVLLVLGLVDDRSGLDPRAAAPRGGGGRCHAGGWRRPPRVWPRRAGGGGDAGGGGGECGQPLRRARRVAGLGRLGDRCGAARPGLDAGGGARSFRCCWQRPAPGCSSSIGTRLGCSSATTAPTWSAFSSSTGWRRSPPVARAALGSRWRRSSSESPPST